MQTMPLDHQVTLSKASTTTTVTSNTLYNDMVQRTQQ